MDNQIDQQARQYLEALYSLGNGDPEARVSMYEVGAVIGMDKSEAGRMAENLMVEELVELRTLSGGISITVNGLALLGISSSSGGAGKGLTLGPGLVLEADGRKSLDQVLASIRSALPGIGMAYPQLEEAVIDLKTIETQLLSPNAKIEVIRLLLRSLDANLADAAGTALRSDLKELIES